MSSQQFLILGTKLIGVLCLAWAIEALFELLPAALRVSSTPLPNIDGSWLTSRWPYLIIPPFLFATGLYLIKNQPALITRLAEPSEDVFGLGWKRFFTVSIQVFGGFLIASHISASVSILINIFIIVFAPVYLSTEVQFDFVISTLMPCVIATGLGVFCLWKARLIARFAFPA